MFSISFLFVMDFYVLSLCFISFCVSFLSAFHFFLRFISNLFCFSVCLFQEFFVQMCSFVFRQQTWLVRRHSRGVAWLNGGLSEAQAHWRRDAGRTVGRGGIQELEEEGIQGCADRIRDPEGVPTTCATASRVCSFTRGVLRSKWPSRWATPRR